MAAISPASDEKRVFINCPFDDTYKQLFDATVFAVHDLGFQARHALIDDDIPIRLKRIAEEMVRSTYSIHDLSRVELGGALNLPRFNMPFEAGIAFGLNEFAAPGRKHHFLLLDAKPYRYQADLSDAAGLDIKVHDNKPEEVIAKVRQFLAAKSGQPKLQGAANIRDRYLLFLAKLPPAAAAQRKTMDELISWDYVNDLQAMMVAWMQSNPP